jgi:hypothetical protein
MEDLIGPLLVFMVAIAAAGFALWVAVALLMRLIAFLIYYWVIVGSLAVIGGLLIGLWLPWRTLKGRGSVEPKLLTPALVVAGQVVGVAPRGESKNYGWDLAWPNYIPFQGKQDGIAVFWDAHSWVRGVWTRTRSGVVTPSLSKMSRAAAVTAAKQGVPEGAWLLFALIPLVGLWVGVWVSVLSWLVIMFVLGAVVSAGQQVGLLVLRWNDVLRRRKNGASMMCIHCFAETVTPSFRCSNPECLQVHRKILPGPLGVAYRRCACGTQLPTTVARASKAMQAVCPFCNEDMAEGSGLRRTIQIAVIGAVGAGKTRLIAAAAVGLQDRLARDGAQLSALSPDGERVLEESREVLRTKAQTIKTARSARPRGVPLVVTPVRGRPVELHLFDAAGEYFADWNSTSELRYLDNAPAMLFVLDPLALPVVALEMQFTDRDGKVVVATGDQEEAYASAIDRLRQEGIPTNKRSLGVVISKGDVLMRQVCGQGLASASSQDLRSWLVEQKQDLFVGRMERDFRVVEYFLIDSMETDDLDSDRHPLVPVAWVSSVSGAALVPLSSQSAPTVDAPLDEADHLPDPTTQGARA